MRGDLEGARVRLEEALADAGAAGDRTMVANTLRNLGTLAKDSSDYELATTLHRQALELSREAGDRSGISSSLINLADVALARGDAVAAETLARESVDLASALGHEMRETMSLLNLGLALLELRKDDEARAAFGRAVELCRRHAYREGAAVTFVGLAELALREEELVASARLLGAAEAQLDAAGAVFESGELVVRDRTLEQLEDVLGASAVQAACSEGAGLSLEQALDEAASEARGARAAAPGGT
jgi:tetratricopeptide (TPR) repeat protein